MAKLLLLRMFVIFSLRFVNTVIPRPEFFYGSETLLNGYCDEAQYFVNVFALSDEIFTVKGLASDVTRELDATNETGYCACC